MKPTLPTIRINGKIFHKEADICDAVNVSFYRNAETQQEVRVRWDAFFGWWAIVGTDTYYEAVDDLTRNIEIREEKIPLYFTQAQEKQLDILLTETLLRVGK